MEDVSIPAHDPRCSLGGQAGAPGIASPQDGMEYCLRPGIPLPDQRLALVATVSQECTVVYWFLDGTLFWKGSPRAKVFMDPQVGSHRLTAKDDYGRSASVTIRIIDENGQHLASRQE
jgi:penicillin-binding protein 1C